CQLELLDTPPVVLQSSPEGRLPRDVAGKPDGRRIEAAGDLHRGAFGLRKHRLQVEVFLEGGLALTVNVAHGSADLGVRIDLDVLHQKIEQSPFALEEG